MRIASSKIKGIVGVSASNLVALTISLVMSFVLPLFISVEQYGYWQLFILYTGYVGLFVLGFNDGVHLNYATYDYNTELASKFRSFKRFLYVWSGVETVILSAVVYLFQDSLRYDASIYYVVILNILPTAINGLFTYMNQATLRFKQYSVGNIVDKVLILLVMIVLIGAGAKSALPYMIAFTVCRYIVIIYHYYSSREVFCAAPVPFRLLRTEIKEIFVKGFPLMIAIILGGPTIIVGGRLLVEKQLGIEAFSSYSFALHTLIIAGQFITAIATVFYPIMKRSNSDELSKMYYSFDKVTTLFAVILLFTYYPAAVIVKGIYSQYAVILDYFYVVYPLFIFQCKASVLINNIYKVKNKPLSLIAVNALGTGIHLICVVAAFAIRPTVSSVALSTLFAFCLWYYMLQIHIYKKTKWELKPAVFSDLVVCVVFIAMNNVIVRCIDNYYYASLAGLLVWGLITFLVWIPIRSRVTTTISEFKALMRD